MEGLSLSLVGKTFGELEDKLRRRLWWVGVKDRVRDSSTCLLTVWIVTGSTLSSCSHCTRLWSLERVAVKQSGNESKGVPC